ncbi:MAG: 23S rRNA (uracil(1939)-C(5))-methyltransferase RlmD [Bacteroidales bacterium]
MSRNSKKKYYNSIFENIEISDFAAEGKALCRIDNMVVFVRQGAPGDIADLQIVKVKRRFMEAEIVKFHKKSELRVDSFCEHFGTCGGCKWQHLKYDKQLEFKQKQVTDNIERIGEIPNGSFELLPIAASEKTTFYRNKMEYTFTNRRWLNSSEIDSDEEISNKDGLGFHVPGFFDKVMDIEKCHLQPEPSNHIRLWTKKYAIEKGLDFYDIRNHCGWLKNLIIRNNIAGEFMVNLVVSEENEKQLFPLLDEMSKEFKEIKSVFYTINAKKNSSMSDLEAVYYKGDHFIEEKMEDLSFKIGPNSFYQTNSEQAYKLYSIAREFAGLSGNEIVYDLYTGTGTIACFVASMAKKVVGIEYVEEAIRYAKENTKTNNISNAAFYCGDLAATLTDDFIKANGKPDVIITDPPRAGMHPKVIEQICSCQPEKVVYVSCNPATQARDIKLMEETYELTKSQAVDMFPHTQHVENVCLLSLRKNKN